eukprot:1161450-Pelagomonas_calceolata.AAC.2
MQVNKADSWDMKEGVHAFGEFDPWFPAILNFQFFAPSSPQSKEQQVQFEAQRDSLMQAISLAFISRIHVRMHVSLMPAVLAGILKELPLAPALCWLKLPGPGALGEQRYTIPCSLCQVACPGHGCASKTYNFLDFFVDLYEEAAGAQPLCSSPSIELQTLKQGLKSKV